MGRSVSIDHCLAPAKRISVPRLEGPLPMQPHRLLAALLLASLPGSAAPGGADGVAPRPPAGAGLAPLDVVRGMTISCQTWGWEWGTEGFGRELDELAALGTNWIAIHPYARIRADGSLSWRPIDPDDPPDWLRVPLEETRRRGMGLLIKPHIAYWGSPFRWRGEIAFADPEARRRFFEGYGAWVEELARATRGAQGFVVGTELDGTVEDEAAWRAVVARVRAVTDARLTYAANWDSYGRVGFWDALDAIGIQGYFPLSSEAEPDERALRQGWSSALEPLRALHEASGKPVVLTELGYNVSLDAARAPYAYHSAPPAERERAQALQARCMRAALEVLGEEHGWLRGAFLWKWFVGKPGHDDANFLVDTPELRAVLAGCWRGASAGAPEPGGVAGPVGSGG